MPVVTSTVFGPLITPHLHGVLVLHSMSVMTFNTADTAKITLFRECLNIIRSLDPQKPYIVRMEQQDLEFDPTDLYSHTLVHNVLQNEEIKSGSRKVGLVT